MMMAIAAANDWVILKLSTALERLLISVIAITIKRAIDTFIGVIGTCRSFYRTNVLI